jgi:UbiD family decarboxylase
VAEISYTFISFFLSVEIVGKVRDFLGPVGKDIKQIEKKVSSHLELAKYLRKHPTTPMQFNNVDDSDFGVIGNLWSTRERIARAMNVKVPDLTEIMEKAMDRPVSCSVGKGEFQATSTTKIDLYKLPVPVYFKKDGGAYFTSAMIAAQSGKTRNISYHRMMVLGKNRVVARLVKRHLYHLWMREKKELKIAIFMTLEPEVMLAGAMSVSLGVDELEIASSMKKIRKAGNLKLTKLKNGIKVPASSEIVFEGRLTKRFEKEGPFVDITGTYDKVRNEPVIVLDRMYRKKNPLFYALHPGGNDHFLMMGMPREPVIRKAVRNTVPDVGDVRLSEGGCGWLHGVVAIEQQKPGDAKNAILAALGAHPSMKKVVLVDKDIDVFDDRQVEWAIATRFQADRDLVVIEKARGSSLDESTRVSTKIESNDDGLTAKIGLDATMPFGETSRFSKIDE